jgi:hypothetical protein
MVLHYAFAKDNPFWISCMYVRDPKQAWGNILCYVEHTAYDIPVNSHQLSFNSCSRLTGAWELRKFSCKLSLHNSHQLSCNCCSRLTEAWELRKFLCKLSLHNSHQLSCNSCSRLTGAWELRKLSKQTFASQLSSTLMQLLFSFYQGMRVEKILMQTLASQLSSTLMQLLFSFDRGMRVEKILKENSRFTTLIVSCNSCSRLTGAWELRKLSKQTFASQLSSTLINSHATLVLVWPRHESWENSQSKLNFASQLRFDQGLTGYGLWW